MAHPDKTAIRHATTQVGLSLSDGDLGRLASGKAVPLAEGDISSGRGSCSGIKLVDLGNGCGLYLQPFPPGVSVCCDLADSYRTDSADREEAPPAVWDSPPALMIESVLLRVHTTEDDKDHELWWDIRVMYQGKSFGETLNFGKGVVWPNGDQRDVRIGLAWPFPFQDRLRLSLAIHQRSSSKNYGWEGRVSARAILAGGRIEPVLSDTGNFKLGESGNPVQREFPFNQ